MVLPILHLREGRVLSVGDRSHRAARNFALAAAAYSQHSLEFVWENFDEAGQQFSPVFENPFRAAATSQRQVSCDKTSYCLLYTSRCV